MMDDRLREIKARADAASEYPWRVNTKENMGNDWLLGCVFDAGAAGEDNFRYIVTTDHIRCSHMNGADAKDDATFIAHARADVPWLLKEAERLRDALVELVEVARLRGDNELPHPADDPVDWTARMQTAWDEAEAIVDETSVDRTGEGEKDD